MVVQFFHIPRSKSHFGEIISKTFSNWLFTCYDCLRQKLNKSELIVKDAQKHAACYMLVNTTKAIMILESSFERNKPRVFWMLLAIGWIHTELANIGSVPGVNKGPTACHRPKKVERVSLSYSPYKLKMTSRKLKIGLDKEYGPARVI